MSKTYFLDLFGCAKNQVDAETLMSYLNDAGWTSTLSAEEADLVVVNSCGFIETAKRESINATLEHKKNGKRVVLAGCLAERYAKDLFESLPEADVIFGVKDLSKIASAAESARRGTRTRIVPPPTNNNVRKNRPLLSLPGSAYVKITEGCNNRCSFCSIPLIRGGLKSRQIEDIVDECQTLLDRGVRELCLVGQDVAAFGMDFSSKQLLPTLLEALSCLNGDFWTRLLYLHPDHFPPILDFLKEDGGARFLPYFDIPFQHASKSLLQKMNRKGCAEDYLALLARIRDALPSAVIRSTFLLGFPGETDADVETLLDFQEKARLDWAGCFTYSREENTPAYAMKPRVHKNAAERRKALVEEKQIAITERRLERFVGREFDVLVEEAIDEELYLGRMFAQAPEVDGAVVVHADAALKLGSFVRCKITARAGFDLTAEILSPP
ncbi:MAG: 30S ribosomal protein S12 methylthiotransferase RimO [Treponema sp.]|jgi:ribosomal protein S12 methylthiotransferase|nr:30S ribosomal protein S12 methylthiotransferase RimO [Treponema sp.]